MINISKPSIGISEQEAIAAVLKTAWIGQGNKVVEFEEQCKKLIGCKHFIALSSCTRAIEVSLLLSGFEPGDEIIVPSFTYASVVQIIVKLGLVPVFTDIDPETLNISIQEIASRMSPKTRFILPLHFRGHSCDMKGLQKIAEQYNLLIIEDAAHAFGSFRNGKAVGSDSYAACFSFGPLKNICCIEGGGIATNDSKLAEKIINYRNLGMAHSTWQRYNTTKRQPWIYEVVGAGDKCQMNDVGAGMGLAQLARFPEIIERKKSVVRNYLSELSTSSYLRIPALNEEEDLLYIFTVLVEPSRRDAFMKHLLDKNIGTAVHYYPAHLQPYFSKYYTSALPVTENIGNSVVTLPSYTDLSESDQAYVIDWIKKFDY